MSPITTKVSSLVTNPAFAFCFTLACSVCGATEWSDNKLVVNGSSITIVLPTGYERVQNSDSRYVYTEKIYAGTTTRLLAGYFTETEFRHALVTQFTPSIGYKYTPEKWAQNIANYKNQFPEFDPKQATQSMNDTIDRIIKAEAGGANVDIKIDRPVMLPIFDESMKHYSSLILLGVNMSKDGANERRVVVGSCTIICVKGQILTVFIYEPFVDKNSYAVLQDLTKEVVKRTLGMNPE